MKRIVSILLGILILTISVGCGQSAKASEAPAAVSTEKPYVETKETITAEEDGRHIVGVSYTPKNPEGKLKTVIFCHGYKSSYFAGRSWGQYLAELGYASFMFDFCGGSTQSKSDGNFEDMTCETELRDLAEIVPYVSEKDFVDTDALYLMGESMGGFVSTVFLYGHQEAFRGLILLWPAFSIPADAKDPSVGTIPDATDQYRAAALAYYGKLEEIQSAISVPVLLFHGDTDEVVPVSYSRDAAQCFPNVQYFELEGAGHGNLNTAQKELIREQLQIYLAND